jgi:hypothetical protein
MFFIFDAFYFLFLREAHFLFFAAMALPSPKRGQGGYYQLDW